MDFLELVNHRQSVRKYTDQPVEKEKIIKCIEAARLAPSACNAQPWKFIIVDDPDKRGKIAKETYGLLLSFNKFSKNAPVVLAIVIEPANFTSKMGTALKNIHYPLIDIGIAAEHFCLQAAEIGLGTCMIGWFNEKPVKKILNVPDNKKIGLLITIGYEPNGYKQRKKIRKSINNVVSFNRYD